MATKINYYEILGLSYNASLDDIKKSYKKLAVKYHPDKTKDKKLNDLFIKVQEAYEILKNPEKKKKYDTENRFDIKLKYAGGSSSYEMRYGYQPGKNTSHGTRMPGYFGFYQHFYKAYEANDVEEMQRKAQEEKERVERENQALKAAKLAKKRMEERIRREAEERIRLAKEQEKQKQKQMHSLSAEASEQNKVNGERAAYMERKRDAFRKEWEHKFVFAQLEDILNSQNLYKQKESSMREDRDFQSSQPSDDASSKSDHFQGHGNEASDPIVLDDEEAEFEKQLKKSQKTDSPSGDSEEKVENKNGSDHKFSHAQDEVFTSTKDDAGLKLRQDLKNVEDLFDSQMHIRPRQEPAKVSQRWRSPSPKRPKPQSKDNNQAQQSSNGAKRRKNDQKPRPLFLFEELKNHLATDIESVDFKEVLESLPEEEPLGRNRKLSENLPNGLKMKKPKVAEYSDGFSKAETLHTPINKNSVKGHAVAAKPKRVLTMLDFHASPAIYNYCPPTPPKALLDSRITSETWLQYVESMKKYQNDFLTYKRNILQYQLERSRKDEEFFDLVNSSSSCFGVYQQCLERDNKVLQEYLDLLATFTNTLKVYKQNCNWVKMSGIFNSK